MPALRRRKRKRQDRNSQRRECRSKESAFRNAHLPRRFATSNMWLFLRHRTGTRCFIELVSLPASTLQALEIGDSCRRQWVIQVLLPVRNNLKPLKNGEDHRHRGPCTAIAARNGDATAVTLNQILDQRKSDSQT